MSTVDLLIASSMSSSGPSSITAAAATVTVFTSSTPGSVNTTATPVGLSECVQRCVINVATGGPYGTCTDQLQDMNCICSDERFQAATDGCIFNVCPKATRQALVFASQFCAGVLTPAWAITSATGYSNATIKDPGLSTAAVAGVGIGSAIGGMCVLAIAGALLSSRIQHHIKRSQETPRSRPHAELPSYQTDAKEAPSMEESPISPGSSYGKSPIETVLSREEQDELHALREKVKHMEEAMANGRDRVELDSGADGLREMAS